MLKPGLCSVTLKHLTPEAIIDCVSDTPLQAIEWWGGDHVPPNRMRHAAEIGRLTRAAGLEVASYGSYYRAGAQARQPPFEAVLETAAALESPAIRIWAGEKNANQATEYEVARVVDDTFRIAELAAHDSISITFEFHRGTLTNSAAAARSFANLVPLANVHLSWQPPLGLSHTQCSRSLSAILDRLSSLHVFHWTAGSSHDETSIPAVIRRHPLAKGSKRWETYLAMAQTTERPHSALLEFVPEDSVEQVKIDAVELARLCKLSQPR